MNRLLIVSVSGALSLVMAGAAHAAPAWCKDASAAGSPDLRDLASKDVREVLKGFVAAECAPSSEVEAHRAEIEKGREAWSKKLGMVESDWADAVAYAQTHDDYSIPAEVSTKVLASATPLDQYALIMKANESFSKSDPMYAADMFDANLSEAGRFAFLSTMCFDKGKRVVRDDAGILGTEVYWAVCQPDFEKFDLTKLFGEIHADTAHDGALKMKLRVAAYNFPKKISEHAAEVAELFKRDDANKKLFEVAAGARSAWASGIGKDTKLLDLVLTMESASLAQSRKQLEGCEDKTQAALSAAVSVIPAKAFIGFEDERYGKTSFAQMAMPVLAESPAVNLAAMAYVLCTPKSDLASYLEVLLEEGPGARGPRNAARAKIRATPITYDNVGAKLGYIKSEPYGGRYLDSKYTAGSGGGILKSTKPQGDLIAIDIERTTQTYTDCIKSHQTNHLSEIHADGTVRYEQHCDKSGKVTRDNTEVGFKVEKKYAPVLKPGVKFSSIGKDIVAIWPSKTAKAPSMVLGAPVK